MPRWVYSYFPFVLLNWAVRYFPILRTLEGRIPPGGLVLDIGSGSIGLAAFYRCSFVGCDLQFPGKPRWPMIPVQCSGTKLPFADESFPAVLVSDVLEHVHPDSRATVVNEALRVTQGFAVFGFPSGELAFESDRSFCQYLKDSGIEPFDWLEEHLRHAYPTPSIFDDLGSEWLVESFGNENLAFHNWLSRSELSRLKKGLSWILLNTVPGFVERVLGFADRAPFYRQIVVVTKGRFTGMNPA